jgi:hypothetical protein
VLLLWAPFAFLWLGGIIRIVLFGGHPPGPVWAAPAFLLLAAASTVAAEPREWRALVAAACIGFAVEVLGVQTRLPFGAYRYSAVLAPSFFGVPVAIAGAWLVLIAYVRQMQVPLRAAAVWMAAIDLIIEPLAAGRLNYWRWSAVGFWYLASVLILYAAGKPAPRNFAVFAVGLSIQIFFTVIAAALGLYPAAAVGVALCLLGIGRWRMSAPEIPVYLPLD